MIVGVVATVIGAAGLAGGVYALSGCANDNPAPNTCRTLTQWFGVGPTAGNTAYVEAIEGALGASDVDTTSYNAADLAEMSSGKTLVLDNVGLGWPTNIEALTGLATLTVTNNAGLADISFVNSLTDLTTLNLSNNAVIDISAAAGGDGPVDWSTLAILTNLDLGNNQIDNISALANAASLSVLNLEGNIDINDISFLSGLTALTSVNLLNTDTGAQEDVVAALVARCVDVQWNEEYVEATGVSLTLPESCTEEGTGAPETGAITTTEDGAIKNALVVAAAVGAVLAGVGAIIFVQRRAKN